MGRKHVKSRPGLFGTVYYYDEHGNPIGKSRPGLLEGTRVYTGENGRYAGKSRPGFFAKEVFTDTDNNHITSYDSLCGEIGIGNEHRQHNLLRVVFPSFTPCVRLSPHTAFHRDSIGFGNLLSKGVREWSYTFSLFYIVINFHTQDFDGYSFNVEFTVSVFLFHCRI